MICFLLRKRSRKLRKVNKQDSDLQLSRNYELIRFSFSLKTVLVHLNVLIVREAALPLRKTDGIWAKSDNDKAEISAAHPTNISAISIENYNR